MALLVSVFGGLILGCVAYVALPTIVAGISPTYARKLERHYGQTAMALLGRALLVKRKHGGWYLKRSSFDAEYGKEKTKINGETKHFDDPENLMSRLYTWPLGLVHEKSETILDARFAELGEILRNRARAGELFYEQGGETYVNGTVRVADDDDRLVNLDYALALVQGDADPGTTDWSIEITKQSQSPFSDASFVDYIGAIVAFFAPIGAGWALVEMGVVGAASSGGGGSVLGIGFINALGVLPL